jgi:two-component system, OmpR family, phosphate regulon sensor histidine kinase PhoR
LTLVLSGIAGYLFADYLTPAQRIYLFICFIFLAMFGTLYASRSITNNITEQLNLIEKKANEINAGDFGITLPGSDIRELTNLIEAINTMSLRLKSQISSLSIEKEKFDSLLQNLKEGVFAINPEKIILFQNTGIPKELIEPNSQYRNLSDAVVNNSLLTFIEGYTSEKPLLDGKIDIEVEKKYYNVVLYPLKNNHRVMMYIGVVVDRTEEKEMQNVREEFVQSASHELKTPITSIKGYTETLLEKFKQTANGNEKKFLEAILRNTDRMIHIIDDMLMISKLENYKTIYQPEQFHLSDLVEDLKLTIDGLIKLKKQKFISEIPEETTIYADRVLMEHVLLNLVKNASSYSPEEKPIFLRAGIEDGFVFIHIIDEGSGISDEDRKRIFERFYRVDKNRSRKEGGTGLGLSIVKHIIKLHSGEVNVFSNPKGEGSIFTVKLPLET